MDSSAVYDRHNCKKKKTLTCKKKRPQKNQVRGTSSQRKLNCKAKVIKTCLHKKKKRKKIGVRRIISKPRITIVAPQGIQGPTGQQGIQGPAGTEVTSVSVIPNVQRYFSITESDIPMTTSRTFPASQFVNDAGDPVSQFADHGRNGYFNLFINAVLQEGQLYSVNSNTLTIQSTGQTIKADTPIILESVGFTTEIITNLTRYL